MMKPKLHIQDMNKFFVILILFFTLSICQGMVLETDINVGAQTTEPLGAQYGLGVGVNTHLTASIIGHIFSEINLYNIKYIDKNVLYKELHLGTSLKLLLGDNLLRFSGSRAFRFYSGLNENGYRLGIGIGRVIQPIEVTLNFYKYYNINKNAVVLNIGRLF